MMTADPAADGAATEREIITPVDLCDEGGRLAAGAAGWSRRPLHRANLKGPWGRRKRWEYWCVTTPHLYVSLTYADVDYVGIAGLWICRPADGLVIDVARVIPLGRGVALPDQPCTGRMAVEGGGLSVTIDEQADHTRLTAWTKDATVGAVSIDLTVERPADHETLNVVIPWSPKRFQYTSKQNTRPAHGEVRLGDQVVAVGGAPGSADEAFGTLDLGRGLWPYSIRWNWGTASGRAADGRTVGLQFGGKWTEGTGHTENGLCVDGRLTKIHDELEWTYDWDRPLEHWRVRDTAGGLVDATLTPVHDKHSRTSLGVLSMEVHQVFGTWAGTLRTEAGEELAFDGVVGWAEEARNRW
ncbi:MAG: DUF2804 domain-containing protein [Acidimicrobiales bacterium]|nr:DUF2804 domain-containing protein [Acidimicrobiales bacterium]